MSRGGTAWFDTPVVCSRPTGHHGPHSTWHASEVPLVLVTLGLLWAAMWAPAGAATLPTPT